MRFRFLTRHFALGVPYPWVPFATRFRDDDDVVGAAFFEEFARRTEARFHGRGTDTGLMDDFDALASDHFDPSKVDPIIRDFYEHTTRFDLELKVHWSLWFYPVGWLYKFLVSRRMRQFDIPEGVVEHLQSWIELIDIDKDGDADVRAWVRIHGDQKHPMWVGAYKIYTTETFGSRESYVSVAFPLPGGNLTTVLSPGNLDGGGFSLRSDDRESEEAGMYHIFPRSTRFAMVPGYGMHEVFEIRPTKGRSEIEVAHTAKWFFLTCFTMNYQIRPKRQRAQETLATFVDVLRDPKPPPQGGLRARWRRSRRTDDAPR
jgi:hypothetical protein